MTYINEMIDGNPDKYNSLIKARILNNEIKMKLDEYKSVQEEYIKLLSKNELNQETITSWVDLQNENYQPNSSSSGWDFLGVFNNLDDCKKSITNAKEGKYSSIVYYTKEFGNNWSNTCYGGKKGSKLTPQVEKNVITSIPSTTTINANNTANTKQLIVTMKKIQDELNVLLHEQQEQSSGFKQMVEELSNTDKVPDIDLMELDNKLQHNKLEIDTISNELNKYMSPDDYSMKQNSNYMIYVSWIVLVLLTLWICLQLYISPSDDIQTYIYISVIMLALFVFTYYFRLIYEYGNAFVSVFSNVISSIPLPV